jgi:hypothetical protein
MSISAEALLALPYQRVDNGECRESAEVSKCDDLATNPTGAPDLYERRIMPRRILAMSIDEQIGIDGDHPPLPW